MKTRIAFTLIELLIAASISGIIILGLYSAFQSGILSYNRLDSAFDVYQTARVVLKRMEQDLKNSLAYTDNDSRLKGAGNVLAFFSIVDSYEKEKLNSDVCLLKYELKNTVLKRACYKNLDAVKVNPQEPEGDALSSNVKDISFQYAHPTSGPNRAAYEWQDYWPKEGDTEQKGLLPLAVKIKISIIEKDKQQREVGTVEFSKIVSLPRG